MFDVHERDLDSFDAAKREMALTALIEMVRTGELRFSDEADLFNIHLHSFHSYNIESYSPSKIAWLAKMKGLSVAGVVDFDVLDGLDEFFHAAELLNLKACFGMETRVFIPEFADQELTSFGEPGITYHMGIGIPSSDIPVEFRDVYISLKRISQQRNLAVIEKVNRYLSPIEIDYYRDVYRLTPSGNVTERHLCDAYALKAYEYFNDDASLRAFWSEKLGIHPEDFHIPNDYTLLRQIRSKTMKVGGPGYVPPDTGSFIRMEEFNSFIAGIGGIPALTWVDGISKGEQRMEELCRLAMQSNVAAINVIPDARYTPHPNAGRKKIKNLHALVKLAKKLGLLIISGTEMNTPGQYFVDDFTSDDLAPLHPYLLRSAYAFYGHTVFQRFCQMGYLSRWGKDNFSNPFEKNSFYSYAGEKLPAKPERLMKLIRKNMKPKDIIEIINNTEIKLS